MARPLPGDYAPFYENYVQQSVGEDVLQIINQSGPALDAWLDSLPQSIASYAYAPGKWTVAQLLQHMIDTERVFAFRAMCIARGEQQPLPGFDENDYANNATASHRDFDTLKKEFKLLRQSTILLFQSFLPGDWEKAGTASGAKVTTNAMGFIMVGHVLHHIKIYQERYQ